MIAEIIINSNVRDINHIFDYNVPTEYVGIIAIGDRVLVPFGRKKTFEEGFVVGFKEKSDFELKDIAKIQEGFKLNKENIELAKIMARRYFCNISDCIHLMLPPGNATKEFSKRVTEKSQECVYLKKEEDEILLDIEEKKIKSEKQIKTLNFLIDNNGSFITDIEMFIDTSRAIIKTLEKNGYVEIVEKQIERNPLINKKVEKTSKLKLNEEQQLAFETVNKSIKENECKEFLLYGVTGSGKTEVYLQLIEEVLKNKKTSIMLVPEISLTPQTVDRFVSRFGSEEIAIIHSKLSVGERYDQWQKINNGQAKIIIGARSAIFAPVKNLGIIIIDEEHDSSYKSDSNPRFNAKDIAKYMAKQNNVPLILGSATPDTTTYFKAKNKQIELLELSKRANNAQLPNIEIVDLREELAKGNRSIISTKLYEEIENNLKEKKQTILFLNRRGYSTFVMCRDCGFIAKCKNCNITLTYHSKENKLKCHYCGYEQKNIKICPECKSKNVKYFGTGTQKLEEEIKKIFPTATTIRMDVDTTTKKNSVEEILNTFKNENIDILIGTQMVVKGHHFPNVTLVGVIAADSSLYLEDYRANERTFQLLTQVAGRAGREKNKGKVIIQTYNPDNFCIECSKEQDYEKFYNAEIVLRKELKYPPFCDIIVIGISGANENQIKNVSNLIYSNIVKLYKNNFSIYKPLPAPIDKIKNKYRWRIIMKCKLDNNIIDTINSSLNNINNTKVRISIDVNPNNMM